MLVFIQSVEAGLKHVHIGFVSVNRSLPPDLDPLHFDTFSSCEVNINHFVNSVFVCCQKLKDVESIVKIVEVDGMDLVKDYSDEIERMLGSKMKSVKVRTKRRLIPKYVAE